MSPNDVASRLSAAGFEEFEEDYWRHPVLGRFRIVRTGGEWRVEVPRSMMARTGLSRLAISKLLIYRTQEEAVDYLCKLGQTATQED